MNAEFYSHRNGEKIISPDIVNGIVEVLNNIHPVLERNTVTPIRQVILDMLQKKGWAGEYRLDSDSRISISSFMQEIGLCIQTGNWSRIYADLLKLQVLFLKGNIISGIIIVPTEPTAKILGSNMANLDRLTKELPLLKEVITIPILVVGFDGME